MTSNQSIRPIMDPHVHYEPSPYDRRIDWPPLNVDVGSSAPPDDHMLRSRRFSSPQMGYYDLITGEYRYRSDSINHSTVLSNYAGETEPPMCENSCKWCQVKVPFNCLTICLITSLMLLLMFGMFQMILATKPSNPANMELFRDMIWLTSMLTLFFLALILLKHSFMRHLTLSSCPPCFRFDLWFGSTNSMKRQDSFHHQGGQHASLDGEFV